MTRTQSRSFFTSAVLLLLLQTGCKPAAKVTDESLTAAVQSRLSGDPTIATEPIQSSVQDGVVTLNGTVSSGAARALAASDIAQIAGIRTVVNNLAVAPLAAAAPPPAPLPAVVLPSPEPARRETPTRSARDRRSPSPRPNQSQQNQQAIAAPSSLPASAPYASRQQAPVPPPASVVRNVTVPAGSILPVQISQTLDSATTQQGESFSGTIASDVVIDGTTVVKQGSAVTGRVTAVQEAAHFKGSSLLSIELTGVTRRGQQVAVSTEPYSAEGKGRGKNTAIKTGGGAAVGAVLGGIFGGGKGAAIGAGAGGGLGAGANAITRGEQVKIPAESLVRFRLASPATFRVSGGTSTSPDADGTEPQRRPLN